jgi:hypothetical protein
MSHSARRCPADASAATIGWRSSPCTAVGRPPPGSPDSGAGVAEYVPGGRGLEVTTPIAPGKGRPLRQRIKEDTLALELVRADGKASYSAEPCRKVEL